MSALARRLRHTISRGMAIAVTLLGVGVSPATAVEQVDLELVIATDVSFSIDAEEARLQREGIIAAFRSREVIRAIETGALGRIAVAYIDFASRPYNRIVIDWHVIADQASAVAFADKLAAAPLNRGQSTSISDALELASELITRNDFDGTRRVIDVSGDGPNNAGRRVDIVRDEVLARGIAINGLPIINLADRWNSRYFLEDLDRYFEGCVIGGPASFVVVAADFADFARAIRQKLILEIAGIEPLRQRAERRQTGWPAAPRDAGPRAGVAFAQGAPALAAPSGGYHKGCDIGERLRRGLWGGAVGDP